MTMAPAVEGDDVNDDGTAAAPHRVQLCFVLMPFGVKRDAAGREIDFDRVYETVIRPAVEAADLECMRADEERLGGMIHTAMFERLLLCRFAVADLTLANPNVFYELGIRHVARRFSTVLLCAKDTRLPFDARPLRVLRYGLDDAGQPRSATQDRDAVRDALQAARSHRAVDSPLFQLVTALQPLDLSGLDAETFRDQERYRAEQRRRVRQARSDGIAALESVQEGLGGPADIDETVLVDLLLAYRSARGFGQMIRLVEAMPHDLAGLTAVQEQYALALNRQARGDEAEQILERLIAERGPSSESYGLLGRIHKDRWEAAQAHGPPPLAKALLDKAITAYRSGFDVDPRDYYPGVNAVELMYLRDPSDPELAELRTVVRFSAELSARRRTDYWTCATLLVLAVLDGDVDTGQQWLGAALAAGPDAMSAQSTADSLSRLARARQRQGEQVDWVCEAETMLRTVAG